jgi:hypothetical protein
MRGTGIPSTLSSETVATVPADRARTKVGVGEEVLIEVTPPDSVTWSVSEGSVNPVSGTQTTFKAADRAGTATVKATRPDGGHCALTFTVVEPSAGIVERQPGTGIFHVRGTPSVGFLGDLFLQPADVSFQFVEFCEGAAGAVCTGYFTPQNGQVHPPSVAWMQVGPVIPGKGSKVLASDTIQGGDGGIGPPYSTGTFTWAIPWQFRVDGGPAKVFTTLNQVKSMDTAGTLTVSKGGASVSKALNDPSSGY